MLLVITGCLELAMSAAGVYGVVAYTTSRRTQEIGIRMAMGATPRRIFGLIFRQGLASVAVGLAIGVAAGLLLIQGLRSLVVGLEGEDPVWMSVAAGVLMVTAGAACWIPARRATRTDPVVALAHE